MYDLVTRLRSLQPVPGCRLPDPRPRPGGRRTVDMTAAQDRDISTYPRA
jgi:hypothetical protein